ncbi:MAG: heparinase II/III family protein [Phycisphaerae bacterium]|nr:heparinase II/III family protein [Phycisphaerae bacterium]
MKCDKLKNMCLQTELVRHGKSRTVIIIPAEKEYAELAGIIKSKVEKLSGARVEIKKESQVSPEELKGRNPILLGKMTNNRFVLSLYLNHYCFVDDGYPGKNGYVVRTVHNPRGDGRNYVLLGGSSLEGVTRAVKKFVAKLTADDNNIVLDRIIKTESEYNVPLTPSAQLKKEIKKEIEYRITEGNQQHAFAPVLAAGIFYHQTGDIRWSRIFKECFAEFFERAAKSYTSVGMAEYWAWNLIMVWDLVEESPVFSNSERLEITSKILTLVKKVSAMGYLKTMPANEIRWNHQTFNALTLFYGGKYFQKYYNLKAAAKWSKTADTCFQPQANSSVSWDNSGHYAHIMLRQFLNYSLAKSDFRCFENGNVRKMADWIIAIHDNLAKMVTFGDGSDYSVYVNTNAYIPNLAKAAWYYKDGRYTWMIKKILGSSEIYKTKYKLNDSSSKDIFSIFFTPWDDGGYQCNLKPILPSHMLGLKVIPLDAMFYAAEMKGQSQKPPLKKCFDKITFRNSFNPREDYMLLQGTSCGQHFHRDGNSILRYTSRNRIWLVDYGYTQHIAEKYHNTLIAIRDGEISHLPKLCTLEKSADFDSMGFSSTSAAGYNGVDWSRNIFWKKSKYFVVIDNIQANAAADYDFKCLWRMLGDVTLKENTVISEQKGMRFYVKNAGGISSHLREENLSLIGKTPFWQGYPHAGNTVSIWEQRIKGKLQKGQNRCFINLFYAAGKGEKKNYNITEISPTCVRVEEDNAYIGIDGLRNKDISTDAAMYHLSPEYFALAGAKRLRWGTATFESSTPASIEMDIVSGRGCVNLEKAARIEICINGKKEIFNLPKGTHEIQFPKSPPLKNILLAEARGKEVGRQRAKKNKNFKKLRGGNIDGAVTAICPIGEQVTAGSETGSIYLLDKNLKPVWRIKTGGSINDICADDIDGDGSLEILAGSDDRHVYVFDDKGKLKWKYKCANGQYGTQGHVKKIVSADLDGKREKSILAATGSWFVYAFDPAGKKKWVFESYAHQSTLLAAADIDNDGVKEVIQGNNYFYLRAIDSRGKEKWNYYTGREGPILRCLDIINGKIALGVSDNCVHFIDSKGKLVWKKNVGGEVTAVLGMDINNDGEKEILVASESYVLWAFDQKGRVLWKRDLGDVVVDIKPHKKKILVATEEGIHLLGAKGKILSSRYVPGKITTMEIMGKDIVYGTKTGKVGILSHEQVSGKK